MLDQISPPPVLYSYSGVETWLLDCLAGRSLNFSSRKNFNDPFDSQPIYQVDPGIQGRAFVAEKIKRYSKSSPASRVREINRFHRVLSKPRSVAEEDENRKLLDNVGILCLTEEWDEPLFWGHYGKKHQGLCIGYRTDRDVFQSARKIIYETVRPVIRRPQDSNEDMLRKTFLTKSAAWKNEREWRIFKLNISKSEREENLAKYGYMDRNSAIVLADQRGPGIYSFDSGAIESITMGMMMQQKDMEFVRSCVRAAGIEIALFLAKSDGLRYKITRERICL